MSSTCHAVHGHRSRLFRRHVRRLVINPGGAGQRQRASILRRCARRDRRRRSDDRRLLGALTNSVPLYKKNPATLACEYFELGSTTPIPTAIPLSDFGKLAAFRTRSPSLPSAQARASLSRPIDSPAPTERSRRARLSCSTWSVPLPACRLAFGVDKKRYLFTGGGAFSDLPPSFLADATCMQSTFSFAKVYPLCEVGRYRDGLKRGAEQRRHVHRNGSVRPPADPPASTTLYQPVGAECRAQATPSGLDVYASLG